jgi:hypothetical protein
MTFDFAELVKRVIKYLIEGAAVGIVSILIPKKALNLEEVFIIALTAACVLSILDVFVPAAGSTVRAGVGYGAGASLVGFPIL